MVSAGQLANVFTVNKKYQPDYCQQKNKNLQK